MAKKPFEDPMSNNFQVPKKFWQQLAEFSNGGFICFYLDSFGKIQVEANFDSEVAEEGIRAWGARFLNSMNDAASISETQEFLGMNEPGDQNDSDEFNEEE